MEEWKEYKLHEIGRIVGGATPPTKDSANYDGEISWITPKDLSNFTGRYIQKGERTITQKGFESSSCQILPKGSILFSSRAPIGYIAIAANELCTNQGFKSIIPDNNLVNNLFLYYLLKYNKEEIEGLGSGTTFKEVSAKVMQNFDIKIPCIQTQKKIADILSSLDNKIELNKRINDNLEQQAQALFKSWFVDFDPFKDGKFVESELGRIPEGWRVGTLNELIISTLGGDWGKEDAIGNYVKKVSCIRGADIPEIRQGNRGNMPTRFILNKNFLNKALKAEDLVVEISGGSPTQSTGRICQISDTLLKKYDDVVICTNFCRAIKTKRPYSQFIYYLWEYLYKRGVMFLYENGTTGIKNLDINGLLEKEIIVIPDENTVHKYTGICNLFSQIVQSNGYESERLVRLRDTLLPKLMSGELKINDINN